MEFIDEKRKKAFKENLGAYEEKKAKLSEKPKREGIINLDMNLKSLRKKCNLKRDMNIKMTRGIKTPKGKTSFIKVWVSNKAVGFVTGGHKDRRR